jgi:hypothetical protein
MDYVKRKRRPFAFLRQGPGCGGQRSGLDSSAACGALPEARFGSIVRALRRRRSSTEAVAYCGPIAPRKQ